MIIRSKRSSRFTVINNGILEDKTIDWKDLGLLVYLLSKPDDWEVSVRQLIKLRKSGEDAIRNSLKQLRLSGYVVMKRQGSGDVDWLIFDEPQIGKNPNRGNPDEGQATEPTSGKSLMGKIPNGENPDVLINTEYTKPSTEKENKDEIAFEQFWTAYGHKKNRIPTEKAWNRLSPACKHQALINIPAFFKSLPSWQAKPYPATYLNNKRWEDDLTPALEANNETHQQGNQLRGAAAQSASFHEDLKRFAKGLDSETVQQDAGDIYAPLDKRVSNY
ncbi:hypothetical protein [uncultured Methylophaga sp.]|uniref:hypothetical protein n=1 Tax=uncultured Methylophaga sp. TaxID=285271 RepID=UPI0030FC3B68